MNASLSRLELTVVVWTGATLLVALVDAPEWLRVAWVVPFIVVVIGLGWAATFVRDQLTMLAVATGISLGAAVLVSETMALGDRWSSRGALVILAAIAVGGAAVHRNSRLRAESLP